MSHNSRAIRELGYLENKEKCKEGKVVPNHVFLISSVRNFIYDEPLRRYTLYIISSKVAMLPR
jgi:hypothetical protein